MKLGQKGEMIAANYLRKKGYRLVATNLRCRYGEIDIMALDLNRHILVFVEVKTRSSWKFGRGFEALDFFKLRKIKRSIFWLRGNSGFIRKIPCLSWQIDLISIDIRRGRAFLKHFSNIEYAAKI